MSEKLCFSLPAGVVSEGLGRYIVTISQYDLSTHKVSSPLRETIEFDQFGINNPGVARGLVAMVELGVLSLPDLKDLLANHSNLNNFTPDPEKPFSSTLKEMIGIKDDLPILKTGGILTGDMACIVDIDLFTLFDTIINSDTSPDQEIAIDVFTSYVRYYNESRRIVLGFVERKKDKYNNLSSDDIKGDLMVDNDFAELLKHYQQLRLEFVTKYLKLINGNAVGNKDETQLNDNINLNSQMTSTEMDINNLLVAEVLNGVNFLEDETNYNYLSANRPTKRRIVSANTEEVATLGKELIARNNIRNNNILPVSIYSPRLERNVVFNKMGLCPFFSLGWIG